MENIKFNRQELYNLVWSTPMTTLAKKYSISDSGLRKICVRLNVPIPKAGHWQKLKYCKPVEVEELSAMAPGQVNEANLKARGEEEISVSVLSPLIALRNEIEKELGKFLIVPDKLINPDKLIILTKDQFIKKDRVYNHNGLLISHGNNLPIQASPSNLERSFRFMDTFIKAIRTRGHEIGIKGKMNCVVIKNEEIEISLREKLKMIERPSNSIYKNYDYFPSGILTFNAKIWFDKVQWMDGKLTIEKQLSKIIAKLELGAKRIKDENIKLEKIWAEQRERERIRKEKERIQEKEQSDFNALLKNARQWQDALMIRDYIKYIETSALEKNTISDELKAWIEWARRKADWLDPTVTDN